MYNDIYGVITLEMDEGLESCRVMKELVGAERTEAYRLCTPVESVFEFDRPPAEAAPRSELDALAHMYSQVVGGILLANGLFFRAAESVLWAVVLPRELWEDDTIEMHARAIYRSPVGNVLFIARDAASDVPGPPAASLLERAHAITKDWALARIRILRQHILITDADDGMGDMGQLGALGTGVLSSLWCSAASGALDIWEQAIREEAQVRAYQRMSPYRREHGLKMLTAYSSRDIVSDRMDEHLAAFDTEAFLSGLTAPVIGLIGRYGEDPAMHAILRSYRVPAAAAEAFSQGVREVLGTKIALVLRREFRRLPLPHVGEWTNITLDDASASAWDDGYSNPELEAHLLASRPLLEQLLAGIGIAATSVLADNLVRTVLIGLEERRLCDWPLIAALWETRDSSIRAYRRDRDGDPVACWAPERPGSGVATSC